MGGWSTTPTPAQHLCQRRPHRRPSARNPVSTATYKIHGSNPRPCSFGYPTALISLFSPPIHVFISFKALSWPTEAPLMSFPCSFHGYLMELYVAICSFPLFWRFTNSTLID